ncbi:LysR family transcriptional regulator [Gudongella sp. SC589]|jgi:DNA-binding transcriptional LysR family regulator|uniref:LysR family transcriptional regulator n=1 Tax=Gudongella sp. SC589 TaxID=3385990 RepID=UPI0039047B18
MKTKLDPYRIFNQVALEKSLSKAAGKLFISQPAVSQIITQLENDLKVRLFTRTPKGVVLTKEGELLFEYVNAGINLIEKGEKRLNDSKNLYEGELRIGVGDTIARYYLIDYLEKFIKIYPQLKIRIINRTTMELTALLKSGEIDIAVLNLPIGDNSIEIVPTSQIQDILVAGKEFSFLKDKTLDFEDLQNVPFIMLDNRSKSREYVEGYLNSQGISISPEIELGSHDLLLELARIGLGIAFVVKEYSGIYIENEDVFEIRTNIEIPGRSIGICHLKDVSMSPAAEKFVEILLD